jgi:hypothetical protein
MGKKNRSGESPEYIAYKKIAIDLLKERGFNPLEIKEGYDVEYPVNGRIKYTVDVVGIKNNYKVAVECGKTELSKLLNLRKIFNEVLVVNTEKVVEMYEYWKTKYFEDVGKLERKNNELQSQLDWLRKTASEDYAKLEKELEMKKSEVRTLQIKLKQIQKVIAEACQAMKEEQS